MGGRSQYGGGIFLQNAHASIDNCIITSNTADAAAVSGSSNIVAAGGGIYALSSTVVLADSTISNNTCTGPWATTHTYGDGPGIAVYNSEITVTGCRIAANTVRRVELQAGGGIYAEQSKVYMVNSIIQSNLLGFDTPPQSSDFAPGATGSAIFLSSSTASILRY